MILCIVSQFHHKFVADVLLDANITNSQFVIQSNMNLTSYVKNNMDLLVNYDNVLIDLSAVDDEIIDGLNQYRILFENAKIIILASNKNPGDKLLSDIFSMGIFNIVSFSENDGDIESLSNVKNELIDCITIGKSYKEGSVYRINSKSLMVKEDIKEAAKIVKEKIVVQKEIHQNVSKAMVGFIGVQHRVGTTHNAIVSAYFLKNLGYSVAIVESSMMPIEYRTFKQIKDFYDDEAIVNDQENYFTLNDVDFYPNYNISESYKLQAKNYNFIIEDFGCFDECKNDMIEFDRCVIQIIVSGFKEWELSHIYNFFSQVSDERIKNFTYIFNLTSNDKETIIKDGMPGIKKVFLSDYCPDPFQDTYDNLKNIFKGYIPEKVKTNETNKQFKIPKLLNSKIFKRER